MSAWQRGIKKVQQGVLFFYYFLGEGVRVGGNQLHLQTAFSR